MRGVLLPANPLAASMPAPAPIPERGNTGGAEGDRTPDLVIANDALSHLSYGPVPVQAMEMAYGGPVHASGPLSEEGAGLKAQFSCGAETLA